MENGNACFFIQIYCSIYIGRINYDLILTDDLFCLLKI